MRNKGRRGRFARWHRYHHEAVSMTCFDIRQRRDKPFGRAWNRAVNHGDQSGPVSCLFCQSPLRNTLRTGGIRRKRPHPSYGYIRCTSRRFIQFTICYHRKSRRQQQIHRHNTKEQIPLSSSHRLHHRVIQKQKPHLFRCGSPPSSRAAMGTGIRSTAFSGYLPPLPVSIPTPLPGICHDIPPAIYHHRGAAALLAPLKGAVPDATTRLVCALV